MTDRPYPVVAADDFARRFSMRAGSLMWLLGAGASASAGIPTAWDMIWKFKQQLYVGRAGRAQRARLQGAAAREFAPVTPIGSRTPRRRTSDLEHVVVVPGRGIAETGDDPRS